MEKTIQLHKEHDRRREKKHYENGKIKTKENEIEESKEYLRTYQKVTVENDVEDSTKRLDDAQKESNLVSDSDKNIIIPKFETQFLKLDIFKQSFSKNVITPNGVSIIEEPIIPEYAIKMFEFVKGKCSLSKNIIPLKIKTISIYVPKYNTKPINLVISKKNINKTKHIQISQKSHQIYYIPKIQLIKQEIDIQIQSLSKNIAEIRKNKTINCYIPKVEIKNLNTTFYKNFNLNKNISLRVNKITVPKFHIEPIVQDIKKNIDLNTLPLIKMMSSVNNGGESDSEEEYENQEKLGVNVEYIENEPILILFKDFENDSYIQTYETLLLRAYREKYGGNPEIKKLSLTDEWNISEIERYLDEDKIFLIDIDGVKDIDEENLANRLWAIFAKNKGVVIFYTKSEKKFSKYRELLNKINSERLYLKAKIIEVIPNPLDLNKKLKLAKIIYGYSNLDENIPEGINIPMDAILNNLKYTYESQLKKLKGKYCDILGLVKGDVDESLEHKSLKAFIVDYLIKMFEKEGIIPKEDEKKNWEYIKNNLIITEYPKSGKYDTIIVDVYDAKNNINYEIETLFGIGFEKIHKTIEKFKDKERINIIVDNLTALLHLKEFHTLLKLIKRKQLYQDKDIKFFVVDVKNKKIIEMEKFIKDVKNIGILFTINEIK
jgi:hypothetical protein